MIVIPLAILVGGWILAFKAAIWAIEADLGNALTSFIVFAMICLVMLPTPLLYRAGLRRLRKGVEAAETEHREETIRRRKLERQLAEAPELASSDQGLSFASESGGDGQLSLDDGTAQGALSTAETVEGAVVQNISAKSESS